MILKPSPFITSAHGSAQSVTARRFRGQVVLQQGPYNLPPRPRGILVPLEADGISLNSLPPYTVLGQLPQYIYIALDAASIHIGAVRPTPTLSEIEEPPEAIVVELDAAAVASLNAAAPGVDLGSPPPQPINVELAAAHLATLDAAAPTVS